MSEIELGDKVRCKYTGYTGIAVAKTEFINGCVQFSIATKVGKDNKLPMEGDPAIDENSLEIVTPIKREKINGGGPTRVATKQRGY